MSYDPLQRIASTPAAEKRHSSLFDSTSKLAGQAAAQSIGSRREKILRYLEERPSTLFELAAHFGWFDHQISGRLTELAREGLIERTGERRQKPETGCVADVWRVRKVPDAPPLADLGESQGYPMTLHLGEEGLFERLPLFRRDDAPGIPYGLHTDERALRLSYRVCLVECDGCGKPLKMVQDRLAGKDRKVYRCGTPTCHRTWYLHLVHQPGGPTMLGLVMKTI